MSAWAYALIVLAIIGAVSGSALWYKGVIDDGWKAEIAEANAKIDKLESAAKVQIEKSNLAVEVRHAKLEPEVTAIKTAEGCASQPLPNHAVAVLRSLGLLADDPKPADKPGAGAGSTAPAH